MLKHLHYLEEETSDVTEAGAHGIKIRTLIGEKDGAPNFYMRTLSFEPGGSSPGHSHPWEHEVFVLKGEGHVEVEGKTARLKPGDVLYVPPNSFHRFQAEDNLEFV